MKDDLSYDPETGIFLRKGKVLKAVSNGYLTLRFEGKVRKAHRVAWFLIYGKWPKNQIDHIDRNKLNNAINNLREVNTSENCHNQSDRGNSLGFMGVNKHKNKFRAKISIRGKSVHLGLFNTPEEAHNKYLEKKRELLNDFSYIN